MTMQLSSEGVKAEPNVTPMVDVMLVLLIIFMIIIPALLAGFNAIPPQGQNIKPHPNEDSDVILGIDRDGVYYLDKKKIDPSALPGALRNIYDNRTLDKVIFLKADKSIKYDKVLEAMDICAHAGVRVTGMITEQIKGSTSLIPADNAGTDLGIKKGG